MDAALATTPPQLRSAAGAEIRRRMHTDPQQNSRNRRTALIAASISLAMLIGYFLRKWIVG
jgi:hypothetical protein